MRIFTHVPVSKQSGFFYKKTEFNLKLSYFVKYNYIHTYTFAAKLPDMCAPASFFNVFFFKRDYKKITFKNFLKKLSLLFCHYHEISSVLAVFELFSLPRNRTSMKLLTNKHSKVKTFRDKEFFDSKTDFRTLFFEVLFGLKIFKIRLRKNISTSE